MTDFTPPAAGMLSEQVDLPDHQLTLGLMHREEGIRICAWDGERWRHLTQDAAIKYAQQLEADRYAALFAPVSDALRTLVDKVNEIETSMLFKRASKRVGASFRAPLGVIDLASIPTEGRA